MPRQVDLPQAENLLQSREDVLRHGYSERALRDAVGSGTLRRVHRGYYVAGAAWDELWSEGKQLVRLLAVRRASSNDGPIFSHVSAAALWGLPLVGRVPETVHIVIRGRRHSRTEADVARHAMTLDAGEVVLRHGLRCTSLARTVFDVSRTLRPEAAIAAGDSALRLVSIRGHDVDLEAAGAWRAAISEMCAAGLRGVRRARWVSEFADGRAQLPGESVSRLQLHRLGFRDVDLQVPILGAAGTRYFADFGFRRSQTFGEFDGAGKYFDAELRTAPTALDAVLAEKWREDDIRGVTGWRIVRWGKAHIRTAEDLGARLAAFGLRPPG